MSQEQPEYATIRPKRRYLAGQWFDDLSDVTVELTGRMKREIDRGNAELVNKHAPGEVTYPSNYPVNYGDSAEVSTYHDGSTDEFVVEHTPSGSRSAVGSDGVATPSVRSGVVNNEVYASQFDGEGLASKVENALAWLQDNTGGQGRVRVTPKSDGSAWVWDKDITVNPFDHESVEIDIGTNVLIEYPGSGWALTFDSGGDFQSDRKNVVLRGGTWLATTTSASGEMGCIRCIDIGNSVISDVYIDFNSDVAADTYGIRVENQARWSEMNTLSPNYINADYCLSFMGSSFNPDSDGGTDSFQGQYIKGGNYHGRNVCLDFRGNFQYSQITAAQCFLFAEGCIGMRFDTGGERNWGMTISGGKTEEHASDTVSFHLGPGYDGFFGMPTLIGGFYEHPTTMLTADADASNPRIPHVFAGKNAFEIRTYMPGETGRSTFYYDGGYHSLSVGEVSQENGTLDLSGVTNSNYATKDLTSTGGSQGDVSYHDPSIGGDANTEGPAFHDGTNWISLVDGSTIA